MDTHCNYIPYSQTGYFTSIVLDYLDGKETLSSFYKYPFTKEGLLQAIEQRKAFNQNRSAVATALKQQYLQMDISMKVVRNIESLEEDNTFTITTAHQPNIFTGPLYLIYKIAQVIKLAEECTSQFPGYNFVPVYYMGSEDADLDELGYVTIEGERYVWNTEQTGAVGRMKVDRALLALVDKMEGQVSVYTYGNEWINLLRKFYTLGKSIQQATLEMVNELFGEFGLVIVVPDNAALKQLFEQVVEKELKEQFSHKAVQATLASLSQLYKVQAGGRELNLFYLLNDKRERIEIEDDIYKIRNLQLSFTQQEMLEELRLHPERFSANVILRGVFQETILPDIAFVGGGGELAYWFELRKVFENVDVPFPVLILRNSFAVMNAADEHKWKTLGLSVVDLFKTEEQLLNEIVQRESSNPVQLHEELKAVADIYVTIKNKAGKIDTTLSAHAEALQSQAVRRLSELEKKMLRAEKRKFSVQRNQVRRIKSKYFPKGSLQERVENAASFFARYGGRKFIRLIVNRSATFEQGFAIITVQEFNGAKPEKASCKI